MTARDLVVTSLSGLVPSGITVMAYARNIDAPAQDTVMVRIDEVTPSQYPRAIRAYKFALLLIVPQTTPGTADDELDNFLEDVLTALDASTDLSWESAQRATYEEKFPAYEVTLSVIQIAPQE